MYLSMFSAQIYILILKITRDKVQGSNMKIKSKYYTTVPVFSKFIKNSGINSWNRSLGWKSQSDVSGRLF